MCLEFLEVVLLGKVQQAHFAVSLRVAQVLLAIVNQHGHVVLDAEFEDFDGQRV